MLAQLKFTTFINFSIEIVLYFLAYFFRTTTTNTKPVNSQVTLSSLCWDYVFLYSLAGHIESILINAYEKIKIIYSVVLNKNCIKQRKSLLIFHLKKIGKCLLCVCVCVCDSMTGVFVMYFDK